MRELDRQPHAWILYEMADGRLVPSVNCDAYTMKLELTADESTRYRQDGSPTIDALATQVAYAPRRFGARNVKVQGDDVVPDPLSWHD